MKQQPRPLLSNQIANILQCRRRPAPLLALAAVMVAIPAFSQNVGDFRSVTSSNWNSVSTWERYDGANWAGGFFPTNANAGVITIQNGHSVTNTASASSRLPSYFSLSFYDGTKISDPKRGAATFKVFPGTPANQLGNETNPIPPVSAVPHYWYKGSSGTVYDKAGIYKGFDAGLPIFLAAESYFLQSEAIVRGILTGDATAMFNKGIEASFTYLYKDNTGAIPSTGAYSAPVTDATAYRTANATNPLVNFALATSLDQKIEAIITQKYIALTMIHSHESWNEYRRTGYPKVTGSGPTQTMASTVSLSTRPDKMPTRVLYPSSEYNTNSANVPTNINKFSSLIFWAQ